MRSSDSSEWPRTTWEKVASWLFTTDSRKVGVLWLAATLLFFFLGGIAALFLRTELAVPGRTLLGPEQYNQYFTLHGTAMIFLFAVPVFFGFGSIVVPRMVGAKNMAFPRLNLFDFWLLFAGGLMLEVGYFLNQRPEAGWTAYVPLSLKEYTPTLGMEWWIWTIFLETLGTTLIGVNFLVTILHDRKPGMRLADMPLFVWTMLFTSILVVGAGPVLLTALLFLFLDRNYGTLFFDPTTGSGVLLWQDMFWFYSHPATYVMLIPAFGIVSAVVARFTGKPLFSRRLIIVGAAAVTALSFLVWWHHMFVTGMDVKFRQFGSAMTLAIAVPSGLLVFTWLASLWRGRIRFTTPMLFVLGWLATFTIGGADGVYLALVPLDISFHNTYWLVAHFHYIIFGGTVFGVFAGIYYWFPVGLHRKLDERLGKWHFWGTFLGMNLTFFPMHFLGMAGMPRRIWDYGSQWQEMNMLVSVGGFVTAAAQLLFLANLVLTLLSRRHIEGDPWAVGKPQGPGTVDPEDAPRKGWNPEWG